MVLCAARLSTAKLGIVISHLVCVKTHDKIWNFGLVYSINRKELHQLIMWQEFIQNIASN